MNITSFKQLKNNAKTLVASNALNNTTVSPTFSVVSGSVFPTPGNGFYVTAWDINHYPDPGDDPNMRIGLCTARSGNNLTVTWGQESTPINSISGSPAVALLNIDLLLNDAYTAINSIEDIEGNERTASRTVAKTGAADFVCSDYASDSAAIQAAINASSGGTVYLRDGTYIIKNILRLKTGTQLIGESRKNTILQLDPASLGNFISGFLIHGDQVGINGTDGTNCVVRDMTLDGNYDNLTTPTANRGGLMKPQSGWLVENIEFQTSNYFKLYIDPGIHDVIVRRCKWTGLTGAGADCLGGTGGSTPVQPYNILVEECTWEAGINGNPFDIVSGQKIKLLNNTFRCSGYIYLEGCIDSDVLNNRLTGGGGIVVETNAGYGSIPNAINPIRCNIKGNTVIGAVNSAGITLKYDPKGTTTLGGYNQVTDNIVENSGLSGILVSQGNTTTTRDCSYGYDIIARNTCRNNNQDNSASFGSLGYPPSGINIVEGLHYVVTDNMCTDDQGTKTQLYGIAYGHASSSASYNQPNNITHWNNDVSGNKTGSIYVGSTVYTTDISQSLVGKFDITNSSLLASGEAVVKAVWNADSSTAGSFGALYAYSNYAHTGAGGRALVKFHNDNSSSSANLIDTIQDGTGTALVFDINNSGYGIDTNRTVTNKSSSNELLRLIDNVTVNNGATFNKTGNIASISSSVTQTSGTVNDSAKIFLLAQNNAAATGNVLHITNAGLGNSADITGPTRLNGDTTLTSKLIKTASSPPASASATGTAGQIEWDANYIYVCVAVNTWKRVAIATW